MDENEPVRKPPHLLHGVLSRHRCPEDVELRPDLCVAREFSEEVGAVFILVRMVVVPEYDAAGLEQRLRPLRFFDERPVSLPGGKRFRPCPRNADISDPECIDIGQVFLHRRRADMRGDGRKPVFFQELLHLHGRLPVKSGELHAVVACLGDRSEDGFRAFPLRHVAQAVQLNRKFHTVSPPGAHAHHMLVFPSVMMHSLTRRIAFSRPSLGDIRPSSCSMEMLSSYPMIFSMETICFQRPRSCP